MENSVVDVLKLFVKWYDGLMRCQKCKKEKPNLTKNSVNSNGKFQYICRECNTEKAKRYRKTEKGRSNVSKAVYKSISKFPQKQKARQILHYHILVGNLIKPEICQKCGEKKELSGHHSDYSKPLEIEWVCRNCHNLLHNL